MAKVRPFYIFGFLLLLVVIYLPGFTKLQELKNQNRQFILDMEELKKKNEELKVEKARLENDMDYIEKIAREKLGMVKENEIIYKINSGK